MSEFLTEEDYTILEVLKHSFIKIRTDPVSAEVLRAGLQHAPQPQRAVSQDFITQCTMQHYLIRYTLYYIMLQHIVLQ